MSEPTGPKPTNRGISEDVISIDALHGRLVDAIKNDRAIIAIDFNPETAEFQIISNVAPASTVVLWGLACFRDAAEKIADDIAGRHEEITAAATEAINKAKRGLH